MDVIDRTVAKTYQWVHLVAERSGLEDAHRAYSALRAVLHAVRDRLDVNVAVHFSAQLPLLLRGVYYEGWEPARVPIKMSLTDFLARIEHDAALKGTSSAEDVARAVLSVCWDELGTGTMEHLISVLPAEFAELL